MKKDVQNVVKAIAFIAVIGSASLCTAPITFGENLSVGLIEAHAATITNTWDSGNTTVTLDSDGVLTVTAKPGTDGHMVDYTSSTYEPWRNNGAIRTIVIADGVQHLGRFAFYSLPNATKIIINANNLDLHNNVFNLCGTSGILDLELNGSVVKWGSSTFEGCKVSANLINVVMQSTGELGSGMFASATIPDGTVFDFSNSQVIPYSFLKESVGEYSVLVDKDRLTSIGDNAFEYSGITGINLDEEFNNLIYLGNNAFSNNTTRTKWKKEHFVINAPNCNVKYLGALYGVETVEIKAKIFEGGVAPEATTLKVEVTDELVKNKNFGGTNVQYIYIKAPKLPTTDVYYSGSRYYSRNFVIGTPNLKEVHLDVDEVGAAAFYANDSSGSKNGYYKRISYEDKKATGIWYGTQEWRTNDNGTYKVVLDRLPDKIGIGSFIGVTVELPTSELSYDDIPGSAFSDSTIITPNNELTITTNLVGGSAFYNLNEGNPLSKLKIVGKDRDLSLDTNSFRTTHVNNLEIDKLGDTTLKFPIGAMLDYLSGPSNTEKYQDFDLQTVKISNLSGKLKLEQSGIEPRADCGFFSNNKGLESVEISGTGSLEASNYTFNGLDKLTLDIGVPISSVGEQSFINIKDLGNLELDTDTIAKLAFSGSSGTISAPNLSSFGEGAFKDFSGTIVCKPLEGVIPVQLFQGATITNFSDILDLDKITGINESAFEGSNLDLSNKSMPNLTTIGASALKDTNCKGAMFPLLDNLGYDGLNGTGVSLDGLDMSKLAVYEARSFYNNGITEITIDENWNHFEPDAFNELTKIVAMPEITFYGNLSNQTKLEKLYILGGISSNMKKQYMPSITRVYCVANTTTHSWCESEGVPYTLLTDEEVEGLINGALPTLEANTFLFDYDMPSEVTLKVTLGEKPAGASNVSKLIIDNETVEATNWQFNGTDTITINADYLKTLPNGTHSISVLFNNNTFRSGASVTVVNSIYNNGGTTPPEVLDTITYEFYKDYPDTLIVPVKLNGATGLKQLKIGEEIVDPQYYEIQDGAIIVSADYLSTLEPAKYRFIPTFNDKASTVVSNVRLMVYEKAADRAAPYLLQSRITFGGADILLSYDPGDGDLLSNTVLALVLDESIILPDGRLIPMSSSNTQKVLNAYKEIIGEEKVQKPIIDTILDNIVITPEPLPDGVDINAPTTPEDPTGDFDIDDEFTVPSDSDASLPDDNTDTGNTDGNTDEGFIPDDPNDPNIQYPDDPSTEDTTDSNTTTDSTTEDTTEDNTTEDNTNNNATTEDSTTNNDTAEDSTADNNTNTEDNTTEVTDTLDTAIPYSPVVEDLSDEEIIESLMVGLAQQSGAMTLDLDVDESKVEPVFKVEGTQITVSGEYISSLGLSEGDHLMGAIFDNSERTMDLKKVILTIPSTGGNDNNNPDEGDNGGGNNPTPDVPDNGDNGNNNGGNNGSNDSGSSGGGGGSHGGGGGGGSSTKPSDNTNNNTNNNTPVVPDTGGNFNGDGDDWEYTKPDGSKANNEWVGDGKNWYHIGTDGKLDYDWFLDTNTNLWYMLNREHDGTFGAALSGWYFEKQDGKWYYLNPKTTEMLTGWQFINNKYYFLNPTPYGQTYFGDNANGWQFNSALNIRPYGSLYVNEVTPDNYKVDENGARIQQ